MTAHRTDDLQVTVQGDIDPHTAEYVWTKVRSLARYADHPITHARVRITTHPYREASRPYLAQANLVVRRRPIRAQVLAASPRAAVDELYERLRRQLTARAEHWEAR